MSKNSKNSARRRARLAPALILTAACASATLAGAALPAAATGAHTDARSAIAVRAFAAVGSEKGPDDLARLGSSVYVGFQNGVGSMGEPSATGVTSSTIQQYSLDGKPGASWQVAGKVEGIAADRKHGRLLLSTNEDGNSSFHTLVPTAGQTVQTYAYAGLTHGGGTDAITVTGDSILITASAPATAAAPALYRVALSGSTATLTPVFNDNSVATIANGATKGQTRTLALTDPDSNTVVPEAAPRFAGSLLVDGQADQQLIFASHTRSGSPSLQVLDVAQPLDDTVIAAGNRDDDGQAQREQSTTLWITDPSANTVYAVSGAFTAGQAVSSVTPDAGANFLARLDLGTGALTAIPELASIHPKGLLFTSADADN